MKIIFLLFSFCFLLLGIYFFYKANQIKIHKKLFQENYEQNLKDKIKNLEETKEQLSNEIIKKRDLIQKENIEWKKQKEKELQQWVVNKRQQYQQKAKKSQEYINEQIIQLDENLRLHQQQTNKQRQQINQQLEKIRNSLNAGIQARLREQQKKEKINFYKISINDTDAADIKLLETLKSSFHKPVVLSKLIWSQYYQKQITQLCDRVVGKKVICGIYKITDLLTQQCYIGQSVNISDRFKQHCKCGLGIDAPASNKLYNTMQRDKLQNFTFEILEQCSREQLNQKEAFWINMYKSNVYGLNTNKGVVK